MVAIVNQGMEKNFGFLFQELKKSLDWPQSRNYREKIHASIATLFTWCKFRASSRWVRSTYLSCAVKKSWQHLAGKLEKNTRIKPRAAKWEARSLPLCHTAPWHVQHFTGALVWQGNHKVLRLQMNHCSHSLKELICSPMEQVADLLCKRKPISFPITSSVDSSSLKRLSTWVATNARGRLSFCR